MNDKTNHTRNRILQEEASRKASNDREKNKLLEKKNKLAEQIAREKKLDNEDKKALAHQQHKEKLDHASKQMLFKANVERANLEAKLKSQSETALVIQSKKSQTELTKQENEHHHIEYENRKNREAEEYFAFVKHQQDKELRAIDSNIRMREKDQEFFHLQKTDEARHNHELTLQENTHLQEIKVIDRQTQSYKEKEEIDTREMAKRTEIEMRKEATQLMGEMFREEAQGEMKKELLILEGEIKKEIITAETDKEKEILWTEAYVKIFLTEKLGKIASDDEVENFIKNNLSSWNEELDD